MKLNKEKMASMAAKRAGVSIRTAEAVINAFLYELNHAMIRGDKLEVKFWGTMKTVWGKPRIARNPCTGQALPVPARRRVKFMPSKAVQRKINDRDSRSN